MAKPKVAGIPLSPTRLAAVSLILLGLLLPARLLLGALRGTLSSALQQDLFLGALLFKLGLMLLGGAWLVLDRVWGCQRKKEEGRRMKEEEGKSLPSSSFILHPLLLALMLLVSLGLRLYQLDSGLWHDEVITYVNYVSMPLGEIVSTYRDQNQHFLFSILARMAIDTFGAGGWALRLPAVLFGVGSIWALYLFAAQVTGRTEALLSAALLAFSYQHIWFSQNARGYSGLLFWALLASWAFVKAQRRADKRYWLLYSVFCALGVYTHMSMLFMMLGHSASYALDAVRDPNGRQLKRHADFAISLGLTGLFIFQLHALVLPQILYHGNEVSTVPAWKNPLWALYEFAAALRISFSNGLVIAAGLAVFALGAWDLVKRKRAVIDFLLIPCVATAAVVVATGHHLWPRFFFFAFGFMCVVAVRGIFRAVSTTVSLSRIPARTTPLLQVAACLLLIVFSALSIRHAYVPKQDFLGALNFVEGQIAPGDAVATVGLAGFTYEKLYRKNWPAVQTLAQLDAIRANSPRTWLVYTFPPEVRAVYPEIMSSVDRDFQTVRVFPGSVGSGNVFVCRAPSSGEAVVAGWTNR